MKNHLLIGTLKASAGFICFFVVTALVTQSLHIFRYPVILSIFLLALCGVITTIAFRAAFFKQWLQKAVRQSSFLTVLLVLATFAIIGFELYSVHYKYTGEVDTLRGTFQVTDSSYGYPLFSDEWVEAALAHQSIITGSLPLTDPFTDHKTLIDLLTPFHASLSQAFLLTGLDPVKDFAMLAIIAGLLVLASLYVCLRAFKVGTIPSIIIVFAASYIAQAANLPGLWFLLPYLIACIPFFLMLASYATKDYRLGSVFAALTVILYPPFIVFAGPSALIACTTGREKLQTKMNDLMRQHTSRVLVSAILAVALVGACILIITQHIHSPFIQSVAFGLYHPNLEDGIISFPLWTIVPYALLPFAALGVYASCTRDRIFFLITPIIGLILWCIYAFYPDVIIIEYPRVVMITSFLLLISAGIGFEYILDVLRHHNPMDVLPVRKLKALALVCTVIGFSLMIPAYANTVLRGDFLLTTHSGKNTVLLFPTPAATRYLIPEDLAIWNKIKNVNFIAPPWKGLVIGTATGNRPFETKPSFVTESLLTYADFMGSDCPKKNDLVQYYRISYVYSDPFSCPNFTAIASTSEKLSLYLYTK